MSEGPAGSRCDVRGGADSPRPNSRAAPAIETRVANSIRQALHLPGPLRPPVAGVFEAREPRPLIGLPGATDPERRLSLRTRSALSGTPSCEIVLPIMENLSSNTTATPPV